MAASIFVHSADVFVTSQTRSVTEIQQGIEKFFWGGKTAG